MKKYRFLSLLLAVSLLAGLLLPAVALAAGDEAPPMEVRATAALLMDGDYDEVLLDQNAHEKRYPASITKVMTALVVLAAIDEGKLALTDPVTATAEMNRDLSIYGSTQDIKPGEVMSVGNLLHCLLIPSANEAANILGITVAGDLDSFVAMMNAKAQELGCKDTHFANCHGLHDEDHYTTAYDIYLFAREAMKYPTFREIVGLKSYDVPATNLHAARTLRSTNALISTFRITGYYNPDVVGIKTGATPEAGECLVSAAVRDGKTYYAVVMGAENVKEADGTTTRYSFLESSRLLDWGFENFQRKEILGAAFFAKTIPVTLSRQADYVGLEAEGTLEATLPKGLDPTSFQREVVLNAESVEAPVKKGTVLGSVTVTHDGKEYGTLPLVAVDDVERSELLYRLDQVKRFFDQLWVKLALVAVMLIVLFFLLRWLLFSKRRRYGARGSTRRTGYTGKKHR